MDKSKVAFIIPSYNESQNLVTLINKIKKTFKNSLIVVVDDSTGSEKNKTLKALKTFEKDKKFHLISRKTKSGRGNAVMKGFKHAIENKNIKYFFELDADLSHDPQEAILFLNKMKSSKSDLVIGSRYMKKSEIKKWARWRIIMSKNINIFLKYLLDLKLTDYTNGFRLYTRDSIIFLSKRKFRSNGFILLSETAYYLKKNGYKISEVPISFTEREKGKSSMGNRELLSSLYNIFIIRFVDSYKY